MLYMWLWWLRCLLYIFWVPVFERGTKPGQIRPHCVILLQYIGVDLQPLSLQESVCCEWAWVCLIIVRTCLQLQPTAYVFYGGVLGGVCMCESCGSSVRVLSDWCQPVIFVVLTWVGDCYACLIVWLHASSCPFCVELCSLAHCASGVSLVNRRVVFAM